MLRTKIVRGETKALGEGRIQAVVSSESEDRDGDVIRQSGWALDHFQKHPVLLSSHDYRSLRSQIGEWEDMAVRGKRLVGVAHYYIGQGNEEADWGYKLAEKGRAAYSVGFIPDMDKATPRGEPEQVGPFDVQSYEFNGQELLEVSHVTIPSNRDALQLMVKGAIDPVVAEIVREMGEAEAPPLPDFPAIDLEGWVERAWGLLQPKVAEEIERLIICGPIPPHTTPKAPEDTPWDGPAEVGRAEGSAQLRRMHAWVNDEMDADTKAAYKLPHHRADGTVIWRGVAAAMAALMGGRGGVNIPDDDRAGVHRHLARHYEQFDKDPPELRSIDLRSVIEEGIRDALQEVTA